MLRTLLILAVVSLATGCMDRREPHYPHRDRRDHRRHYRATDDAAKAKDEAKAKSPSSNEGNSDDDPDDGGTPMPDVSDDKPAKPAADETSKEMLNVLKGISDKLDKQPQAIHHEFEQFAKMMDSGPPAKAPAAPPAASEPMEPVPQRSKSEAAPEQPSKFRPLEPEGGTLDTPYGNYTGCRVHIDLTGTRRVNGRLVGGRCVACRQAYNALADASATGWTMGDGPQFDWWIVPASGARGTTDPFWEFVENGRVDPRKTVHGFNGDIHAMFVRHPFFEKRERAQRGADSDFPPKAPGTEGSQNDWPDDRRDDRRDTRTPLQQFADWKAAGLDTYGSPDANGGKPLNFMGRALAVRPNGYVGVDEQWHSFGDDMAVATYPTQAAATAAFYKSGGSSANGYGGGGYFSGTPTCSQPSSFSYQQAMPPQSFPVQSYGSGRMVCGPYGCTWQP
jgi:hypothetical protein